MKNFKKKFFLQKLIIHNFATFYNQTINFDSNLNAIIGETGSGKSLILEALELIWGNRAKKQMIRKNAEFASIEAIFFCDDDNVKTFFLELGHPFDGNEIIMKRILYASGKSQSYLNYHSCSSADLHKVSKRYIDLVGQFENQKLLSNHYQLVLLDRYATLTALTQEYKEIFQKLQTHQRTLAGLEDIKKNQSAKEDYLIFQIQEIEKINPTIEEEIILITKKDELIQKIADKKLIDDTLNALSENETGNIISSLKMIIKQFERIHCHSFLTNQISKLQDAHALLEDVSFELSQKISDEDLNEELNNVIDRLDLFQKLKRKFGSSIEDVLNQYHQFKNELEEIKLIDQHIDDNQKQYALVKNKAYALASEMQDKRERAAEQLSRDLTENIQKLNMPSSTVKLIVNKKSELNEYGYSFVDFQAETNPGDGFYQVKNIASGGELSRILLAFRQVIASNDTVSIFLFDEIDSGIGGHTALTIGHALMEVSQSSQVILITHLPQIAKYATRLICVSKENLKPVAGKSSTTTTICEITDKNDKDKTISAMTPI